MSDEYAIRERNLNWNELECPKWSYSIDYLKQTQNRLVESLQNLSDKQLDELIPTNWGDLWPIKKIILTMIQHDAFTILGKYVPLGISIKLENLF